MKNRVKTAILLAVVLSLPIFSTETALADTKNVSIDPREQCYEFTAVGQPEGCDEGQSIWVLEFNKEAPCDPRVWAKYVEEPTPCSVVKTEGDGKKNFLKGEALGDIADGKGNKLSDVLVPDTVCGGVWLRFVNSENDCNGRCYIIGGRKYCI